jgi:hypothetical protein
MQETEIITSGGGGTPSQAREHLYQSLECVEIGDKLLTINDANALFQAYFAEGQRDAASEIQEKIAVEKQKIREENPDE